eukprot:m.96716 g.96716  ORF g.96716 m.96716 type:complete len:181 (-) comp20485_c0_seq1:1906-2448(-)
MMGDRDTGSASSDAVVLSSGAAAPICSDRDGGEDRGALGDAVTVSLDDYLAGPRVIPRSRASSETVNDDVGGSGSYWAAGERQRSIAASPMGAARACVICHECNARQSLLDPACKACGADFGPSIESALQPTHTRVGGLWGHDPSNWLPPELWIRYVYHLFSDQRTNDECVVSNHTLRLV